jgi:hypothetical protein
VHRLLVEEQEDGGADIAARDATASARAASAGATVASAGSGSAVGPTPSAGTTLALGDVLRRVVEVGAVRLGLAEELGAAERTVVMGAGRVPVTVLHGVHDRSFYVDDSNDISKLS